MKRQHIATGYANPTVPFVIEKENKNVDTIHYNANGQRELGKRNFEEYIKITLENQSLHPIVE